MFMQNGVRKMFRDFQPAFVGYFTGIVQYHFLVDNFAKQTFTVMGANGYKI